MNYSDFLIIGSGVAGLLAALKLSELGTVTVITKKTALESATYYAQGGIACVVDENDSFDLHELDTIRAGDGLSHEDVVHKVVTSAPRMIEELTEYGIKFTKSEQNPSNFDLGREGGHSRRRVLHIQDMTGVGIEKQLLLNAQKNPKIKIFENHMAIDLIRLSKCEEREISSYKEERCIGAYVIDEKTNEIKTFVSPIIILATGGAGKVYLYTSNPDIASGDGIALAYRAGARVANLEFVQFHPTCLYHPQAKNFLISEALRGEGAILTDKHGNRFMHKYTPQLEMANRDVVSRAIDSELKQSGDDYVYLDISHKPKDFILKRFPNIYSTCLRFGYDITKEPIPVVPAAHYMCGGVITNIHGETDIRGLFALGETACTGLHGANRLPSNSLLEGVVFPHFAYTYIKKNNYLAELKKDFDKLAEKVKDWDYGNATKLHEAVLISHNWDYIRRLMWDYVGIVRNDKRLNMAFEKIREVRKEIEKYYWDYIITPNLVELRNLSLVSELIIKCAMSRKESRGCHYNSDYPQKDDWNFRKDTILCKFFDEPIGK